MKEISHARPDSLKEFQDVIRVTSHSDKRQFLI
jgi:hypothetical protein